MAERDAVRRSRASSSRSTSGSSARTSGSGSRSTATRRSRTASRTASRAPSRPRTPAQAIGLSRRRIRASTCSSGSSSATTRRACGRAASARAPALRSPRSPASPQLRQSVDARNGLFKVRGGIASPSLAVPLRELRGRPRPGENVGFNFRVFLRGKHVKSRPAGDAAQAGHHRPLRIGGLQAREGRRTRRAGRERLQRRRPPHRSSRSSRASCRTALIPASTIVGMSATVRVGTCSWADETLTKVWYPKGVRSGEARIRHYAERFDTVEANSTYYRLPDAELVANWAERTPEGFTMHVKAFGLMTRHPVKVEALPEDLRDVMPVDERGRVDRPSAGAARRGIPPLLAGRWSRCASAASSAAILLQFPSYIVYKPISLDYLEWAARAARRRRAARRVPPPELAGRREPDADARVPRVAAGDLRDRRRAEDGREEPRPDRGRANERDGLRPASTAATRRPGTSARAAPPSASTISTRTTELEEWVAPLRELAGETESVYAMFNNNGRSAMPSTGLEGLEPEEVAGDPAKGEVAQAPANALMLRRALQRRRPASRCELIRPRRSWPAVLGRGGIAAIRHADRGARLSRPLGHAPPGRGACLRRARVPRRLQAFGEAMGVVVDQEALRAGRGRRSGSRGSVVQAPARRGCTERSDRRPGRAPRARAAGRSSPRPRRRRCRSTRRLRSGTPA